MNNDLEQYTIEKIKQLTMAIDQSAFTAIRDRLIEEKAMAEIALKAIQTKSAALDRTNAFTDEDLEGMAHGNNPVANAYRELLAFRRAANSSAIPDGWKLVPIDPTPAMCEAAYTARDKWSSMQCDNQKELHFSFAQPRYKAMLVAAPKPEGE